MRNFKYSDHLNKLSEDLSCYSCGIEQCIPGHSYGPTVRSGYMFYFILKGKGTYQVENNLYNISQYQGFLIIPNILMRFAASETEPWEYLWIALTGKQVSNYIQNISVDKDNPIFTFKTDDEIVRAAEEIINSYKCYPLNNLEVTSNLYNFLYKFSKAYPAIKKDNLRIDSQDILESAIFIINNNYYDENLNIDSVAERLHIDRSYLYRLFKARVGKSPQEYLINYRIDRAKDLIEGQDFKFKIISDSVGYKNSLSFSREFKRKVGMSPSKYRQIYGKKKL